VRHAEKKYLWRGEPACLGVHAEASERLRGHLRARPARAALLQRFEMYQKVFGEYLANEKVIGRNRFEGLQSEYQTAIDAVEPAVDRLQNVAVAAHEQSLARQNAAIIVGSVLMALLLGSSLIFAREAHGGRARLLLVNRDLETEITERRRTEAELQDAHDALEARVQERTAQLAQVNRALESELSERQKLEAQLLQAHKMDAVGRLAGGIAHDFNNLLMIILGHSELLIDREASDPATARSARRIQEAGNRAAALTRQLLAFSRKQMMQPRVLDLNVVAGEIEQMLRRLIGENIELTSRQMPNLGCVRADPGQIEQVIMNLAVNARDAMPRGGRLTIQTANVQVDEATARRHPGMRPGAYVTLEVRDTGVGMDPDTKSHIFEPFFTTKEKGRGTGLGLATTYGIVKQSDGYIAVESELGQGTAFRIYLPQVAESVETLRPATRRVELPGGHETILLVEDEEHLRNLAREFLEMSGYAVLEAADGAAAMHQAGKHDGPIHLLLTDVIMPGMSGPDLALRLKESRPETRVVFVSGYTDDALEAHGVGSAGSLLAKPFTREAVARKVREALDRTSQN
jgi:signal transduction histidine kinase/ActR/RegA family two-component response regulator